MSSGADLFVVCKNCQSEVSPYVTECPYCGTRLRKRAPKLDRGAPAPPRARRVRAPSLGRLRAGEIPGIRAESRPYVTVAVVLATCLVWIAWRAEFVSFFDLVIVGPLDDRWWLIFTTLFTYDSGVAQFATLVAIAIYGWLLERRFGGAAVAALFLLAGAGGTLAAVAIDSTPLVVGGGGAALGFVCAWAVPELLARRRGEETDGDLLGTAVIAAVLALMPLAREEADPVAHLVGGAVGVLAGLVLARTARGRAI
jgi:membrane associated rhomboid family serine protease